MALGDKAGEEAVQILTEKTVPELLTGVAADVTLITDTIKAVASQFTETVVPAFANGIGMLLALGNRLDARLDGAEIDIDLMLAGSIPLKGTIKLRCPVGADPAKA